MAIQAIYSYSNGAFKSLLDSIFSYPFLSSLYLGIALLLLWRIWTFTIYPLIHPEAPRQLPYWVPLLGHAVAFFKNPEGLLSRGRVYFGNTRQPFAITIAGATIYIIENGEDVTKMYNNKTTLSFDLLLFDMMRSFGFSQETVKIMFQGGTSHLSDSGKSTVHLGHDWQVQQTRGYGLSVLDGRISKLLSDSLQLTAMKSQRSYAIEASQSEIVLSCKKFATHAIIDSIQTAYFGPQLGHINPDLIQTLIRFDKLSWQIFYQFPSFLTHELDAEKRKIVQTFTTYFDMPVEKRPDRAWFTQNLEDQYRSLGFGTEKMASLVMFTYWGINTNVSKVGFWNLAHIVYDPNLMQRIREETAPAFSKEGINVQYLIDSCPLLHAVWLETLRLAAALSSIRHITQDTTIGGKVLRCGNKILVSARQLHIDEACFGDDILSFKPERFLENPSLEGRPSFRPFGGGSTLCPGRILARHTVSMFVALTLHRFDIELAYSQPFPRCEEKDASFGTMMSDDDLILRLKPR